MKTVLNFLKPHTKYSSRKELSFDVLDSSYVVATAGSEAIGRGETLTHVHASELAFWSPSTARKTGMHYYKQYQILKRNSNNS